jgi:hypothetical protein
MPPDPQEKATLRWRLSGGAVGAATGDDVFVKVSADQPHVVIIVGSRERYSRPHHARADHGDNCHLFAPFTRNFKSI